MLYTIVLSLLLCSSARGQGVGASPPVPGESPRQRVERIFDETSPPAGSPLPDLICFDAQGDEFKLRSLKGKGVKFFYIYKSLAHPESNGYVQPFTLAERMLHVREAEKRIAGTIPWLCDTISNKMSYPSWYPDSKSVAVVDFNYGQGSAVKKIDLEQGTAVVLTDPKTHWAGVPRVSPEGSQIVMGGQQHQGQGYSQYKNRIWFLDRGGKMRPLDTKRGWAPCWSPDGKRIAFASDRNSDDGLSAIFVASLDGAVIKQITPHRLDAAHPAWSPDGKLIVFSARRSAETASDQKKTRFRPRGLAARKAPAW